MTKNRDEKVFLCRKCGKERGSKWPVYCDECWPQINSERVNWEYNSGKRQAMRLVGVAKKNKLLPCLKAEYIACNDCGVNRAVDYDHRDYEYPLFVEPVCRSCNIKRGKAKPKRDYSPLEAS